MTASFPRPAFEVNAGVPPIPQDGTPTMDNDQPETEGKELTPAKTTEIELRAEALLAAAAGALAVGAVAFGAVAIGRLAIGRLALGRFDLGRFAARRGRVGELRITRLLIEELVVDRTEDAPPAVASRLSAKKRLG
ncbi:MAG TPA: hypothetical protein VFA03_02620 [Acetobacteraceae bacterium]|nr:hypothetical protein [Acetobacteraceae bacterium]